MSTSRHLLSAATLACVLLTAALSASADQTQHLAPQHPDGYSSYATLAARTSATALLESAALERLISAWQHTPDLEQRLQNLTSPECVDAGSNPDRVQARLAEFAADLTAHKALADRGEAHHAAIAEALAMRISASGDGNRAHPWRVATGADAICFLAMRGMRAVGGYYAAPRAGRLDLVVFALGQGEAIAQPLRFDLSATLSGYRATAAFRSAFGPAGSKELIAALAERGDPWALASRGIFAAREGDAAALYNAAGLLTRAAETGNGVAHHALADLYLKLAADPTRTRIAAQARATARAHHRIAADAGIAYAILKAGLLALDAGDDDEADQRLALALAGGDQRALIPLTRLLQTRDPARARTLLLTAAAQGRNEAAYELAHWQFELRQLADPDALAALMKAADQGHADARMLLGDLHALGRFTTSDPERARDLWLSVVHSAEDPQRVMAAATALIRNTRDDLRDPVAAAAGLARVLDEPDTAARCAPCWRMLAEAQIATGDVSAGRQTLDRGARTLVDADARRSLETPPAGADRLASIDGD